jgi:sugar phosphate isomerase/epimerase
MAATGGSVGLLLDTGHLAFAGADPADIAWRHGPRISHATARKLNPAHTGVRRFPTLGAFADRPMRPVGARQVCPP